MFIVVSRDMTKKNFLQKLFLKNKITVEKRNVLGCKYYAIKCHTQYVPWEVIASRCNGNVPFIVEDGIETPKWVEQFSNDEMLKKLFFNKFMETLNKMDKPSLCIVDYGGALCKEACKIVGNVSTLRVVTKKSEMYESAAHEILQDTGASIMVSDDIKSSFSSDVLFAPFGVDEMTLFPDSMSVYSFSKANISSKNLICPKGITAKNEIRDMIEENINPIRFLCALYKGCGEKLLDNIKLDIGVQI